MCNATGPTMVRAKQARIRTHSTSAAWLRYIEPFGRGASPTDADANGKTVAAAASSDWIRDLRGPRIRSRALDG